MLTYIIYTYIISACEDTGEKKQKNNYREKKEKKTLTPPPDAALHLRSL